MQSAGKHTVIGRFAPSPTGRMHAGNVYASLLAWLEAKCNDGKIVLRIEDLDRERSKTEYIDKVQRDYEMLGLTWDEGPYFQNDRDEAYQQAFEKLDEMGLVYPCFCTRADLHAASAPHRGEKFVYAGTCKHLSEKEQLERRSLREPSSRLVVSDETIAFTDAVQGYYKQHLPSECGDFIIKRSDGAFAYQLAVVVDDAAQGINSVVRGMDLLCSTPQQMYLQSLLGLPHPEYAHIPLLVAEKGRRLSKRDKDASLDVMMNEYGSPEGIIGHIAYVIGLIGEDIPVSPEELKKVFDMEVFAKSIPDPVQIQWK